MITNHEIQPGKGIDKILLGMKEEEVKKILGDSDETDEQVYDDGDKSRSLYYFDHGIDLTFESDDDYRLSFISVDDDMFHIRDSIRVGMDMDSVEEELAKLNWEITAREGIGTPENPDQYLLAIEDQNINLWFMEKVLDEIQIGPFWLDDETPDWPTPGE